MIAARQIFLGRGGAKLPYDAEVEYLEGVDGGYIVLPWAFKTIDRWEIDGQYTSITGNAYNGDYIPVNGIDRVDIAQSSGKFLINYGPSNQTANADTNRHLFVLDALNNRSKIDSTTYPLPGTHVSVPPNLPYLGLLGRIHVSTSGVAGLNVSCVGFRCFSCRLYRNNAIGLDLKPVRFTNELGQSEGAMYDRVSGQLFRNQGTGAFLYGNDK